MGKQSRSKGARRERELAKWLSQWVQPDGTPVVATRMGRNGRTAEDIDHNIPGWHIECKGNEKIKSGNYYHRKAWEQACRDCPEGCSPVLFWKVSRGPWMVSWLTGDGGVKVCASMNADDFMLSDGFTKGDGDVGKRGTSPHGDTVRKRNRT